MHFKNAPLRFLLATSSFHAICAKSTENLDFKQDDMEMEVWESKGIMEERERGGEGGGGDRYLLVVQLGRKASGQPPNEKSGTGRHSESVESLDWLSSGACALVASEVLFSPKKLYFSLNLDTV